MDSRPCHLDCLCSVAQVDQLTRQPIDSKQTVAHTNSRVISRRVGLEAKGDSKKNKLGGRIKLEYLATKTPPILEVTPPT